MPWKNGGGTTTELLVEPPGATLDSGFTLRVSCAHVATSGPFSAFPGCDRLLLLLQGPGMTLRGGPAGAIELGAPGAHTRLAGEWPIDATLHDGPIRDFNVIFARANWRASLEVLALHGPMHRDPPPGGRLLLYVREGALHEATRGELLQTAESLEVASIGRAEVVLVTLAPVG